jgi:dephospho-CoA kinase
MEETAILFETGAYRYFDYSILVSAPESIRIERVMRRDNADMEKVKGIMRNQNPEEENLKLADFVIINDYDSMILPQVLELHERLLSLCSKN